MTIAQELESQADISQDVIFPPSDLFSDEPPLESDLHLEQIMLLIQCLKWLWQDRQDFYAAGNLTIYYSPHQKKSEYFRGPDFFVVLGTELKNRKSWVVWEENGKYPNLIIEILSDSTAKIDKGLKKEIYQTISLEQIYATILYYLQNKESVSDYMKNWIEHGHKMREQQRLNPPPVSEKLRQLRIERQAKKQA